MQKNIKDERVSLLDIGVRSITLGGITYALDEAYGVRYGGSSLVYNVKDSKKYFILKECYPSAMANSIVRKMNGELVISDYALFDEPIKLFEKHKQLFRNEEKTLNNISVTQSSNDDFILGTEGCFEAFSTVYLLIDVKQGVSLTNKIEEWDKDDKLTLNRCMEIFETIDALLNAVNNLHSKNYLHLDISPENVVISTTTGTVRLIDFNSAYKKDEDITGRTFSSREGYSALELRNLAKGNCYGDITELTDVFSVGAIMFRIFIGRVPEYKDKACRKLWEKHLRQRLNCNEKVFEKVKSAISRCIENTSEKRIGVKELKAAIGEISYLLSVNSAERYQDDMAQLNRCLAPRVAENKNRFASKLYIPRTSVDAELKAWEASDVKTIVITGCAGTGKSHYCANLDMGKNTVKYFCEYERHTSINEFIRTIAFELADKVAEYRVHLVNALDSLGKNAVEVCAELQQMDNHRLFEFLIENATNMIQTSAEPFENVYIVIDALDELPHVAEYIKEKFIILPRWVRLVLTTRPEAEIKEKLGGAKMIELSPQMNNEDIKKYLQNRLKDSSAEQIENILAKSEGLFVYAEKVCDALEEGVITSDKLPGSLSELYNMWFSRIFNKDSFESVRAPLSVMCSCSKQLSTDVFCAILGWDEQNLVQFVKTMHSFVSLIEDEFTGKKYLKFFHKSIADWFVDYTNNLSYFVSNSVGAGIVEKFCKKSLAGDYSTLSFEVLELVYNTIRNIDDPEFLYKVAYEAYINSDFKLHESAVNKINVLYECNRKDAKMKKWYRRTFFLKGEVEILFGNTEEALAIFETDRFGDEIPESDIALHANNVENIVFLKRRTDPEEAIKIIEGLEVIVENRDFDEKGRTMANVFYHKGCALYDLKRYDEALGILTKAENFSESFSPGLTSLILILKGWTYFRKDEFEAETKEFERALQLRLKTYGENSHYTAVAYDACARAYVHMSEKTSETPDVKSRIYAEKAVNINTQLFGSLSTQVARNMLTLAMVYMAEGNFEQAREFAMHSMTDYRQLGDEHGIEVAREFIETLDRK